MTIARTQLTTGNNTNNLSSYPTATITPTANTLILILLRTHFTTAGALTLTLTNGTGLTLGTYVQVKQQDFNTIAAQTDTVAIFGVLTGSSPGSGPINIGTSKTCSGMIWEVIQLTGVNLAGGTVASTVQQTGSGVSDTAGTTWTDTFGAAVNTANAVFACAGINNKNAPTATWNNSFTKDVDVGSGESTAYDLTTGHILSGFTGTTHTVTGTSGIWAIVGVEIKALAGTLFTKSLTGTLTFTGTVTKRDNKKVTGALSFTGTITKKTLRKIVGTLSFSGVIHKQTRIPLTGTLTFTGILTRTKVALKSLSGALSFTGTVARAHTIAKAIAGALSFTGIVQGVKQAPQGGGDVNAITHVTKPTRLTDVQRVKDVH